MISFCYIHYRGANDMLKSSTYAKGGCCGVAATCYTIEKQYVASFYNGCLSIFHELLAYGLYHANEQVMTYFYDRFPEKCNIYSGDYYSVASNYIAITEDYDCI